MKNEIIINDKNLSRYNKRLQKIISENFDQKIKLSDASELLAQILGMSSAYELKTLLEKDLSKEFKDKINNPNLSSMEKIIIVSKQVQKMLRETKAEYWYPIFCIGSVGSDYNKYIGKPEYNNIDVLASYTGFRPFDYEISQTEESDDGIADFIDEGLCMECVNFGNIKENITLIKNKSDDYYDESDEFYLSFKNRKEAYSSKKEIQKLNEMMVFCENMLAEIINLMKNYNDVLLVEKDKITIYLGKEKVVI